MQAPWVEGRRVGKGVGLGDSPPMAVEYSSSSSQGTLTRKKIPQGGVSGTDQKPRSRAVWPGRCSFEGAWLGLEAEPRLDR